MSTRSLLTLALASAVLTGCGHSQVLHSQAMPGTQIVTFPNSPDRSWYTYLEANPAAQQGGVGARTLDIGISNGSQSIDQLAIDFNGNVGIRGTLSSPSTVKAKKDIAALRLDPLALLRKVRFISYRYRWEHEGEDLHYGFLAESTPVAFSGHKHDSFELNNSLALDMAATQQLDVRVRALEREIEELKREIAHERAH